MPRRCAGGVGVGEGVWRKEKADRPHLILSSRPHTRRNIISDRIHQWTPDQTLVSKTLHVVRGDARKMLRTRCSFFGAGSFPVALRSSHTQFVTPDSAVTSSQRVIRGPYAISRCRNCWIPAFAGMTARVFGGRSEHSPTSFRRKPESRTTSLRLPTPSKLLKRRAAVQDHAALDIGNRARVVVEDVHPV